MTPLTCDMLIRAYSMGIFPMADSRDDPDIYWVEPQMRGILPLDGLHVSRSLRKFLRQSPYNVRIDTAFAATLQGCADRPHTWINSHIAQSFIELHQLGLAHSVECWLGDELVGGLYGLALGGAFFGESMFSRRTNASKTALVHLVDRLTVGGYVLLDTQFITDHLKSLGATEIPRQEYQQRLTAALQSPVNSGCWQAGFRQFNEKGRAFLGQGFHP